MITSQPRTAYPLFLWFILGWIIMIPAHAAPKKESTRGKHEHPNRGMMQEQGSWLAINNQNYLSDNKKWVYLSHNQVRLLKHRHPLETLLTENSIGYSLTDNLRFWAGFYYSGNNFYHHQFEETRLEQQFFWKAVDNKERRVAARARLEEIAFSNESQNAIIFRQMFAHESKVYYRGNINPLIYDEIFFHLNNTRYTSKGFLSQNRAFLGFNWYVSTHAFFKIGYLNQYITGGTRVHEEMRHLLVINYTFGNEGISLPVDS